MSNTLEFDPFSGRLSRDVRNRLSNAFVESIQELDPSGFRRTANALLDTGVAPASEKYIKDRLARYEEAFPEACRCRQKGVLAQADVLWRNGLAFEVHELLENEWHAASGAAREALKGMIQAAGVFVHMEHGRIHAAASLADKATARLRKHREELTSFESLDDVIEVLEKAAAGR